MELHSPQVEVIIEKERAPWKDDLQVKVKEIPDEDDECEMDIQLERELLNPVQCTNNRNMNSVQSRHRIQNASAGALSVERDTGILSETTVRESPSSHHLPGVSPPPITSQNRSRERLSNTTTANAVPPLTENNNNQARCTRGNSQDSSLVIRGRSPGENIPNNGEKMDAMLRDISTRHGCRERQHPGDGPLWHLPVDVTTWTAKIKEQFIFTEGGTVFEAYNLCVRPKVV
ncbi:hypothetical protein RUND412_002626 [Rhizina undulata]